MCDRLKYYRDIYNRKEHGFILSKDSNMSRFRFSKRYFRSGKTSKAHKLPPEVQAFWVEFDNYQKKHYSTVPVNCLCGIENSYLISTTDRGGWEFPLVLCRSCGLIRAKEYWDQESTTDYYKKWYRKLYSLNKDDDPHKLYRGQKKSKAELIYHFTKEFHQRFDKPYTVVDIGGAVGGVLYHYQKEANCYLFDYNERFLEYARNQGIESIEGGINEFVRTSIKADLIILSHVLEHFANPNRELDTLCSALTIGTLVYVGLPGIDSIKSGRRSYDFLGDIQKAHVFYLSTETLNNLMGRHGFRCLKSDTEIKALYEYTGIQEKLINHYDIVVSHIRSGELKRRLGYNLMRKIASSILPRFLKDWIKTIL